MTARKSRQDDAEDDMVPSRDSSSVSKDPAIYEPATERSPLLAGSLEHGDVESTTDNPPQKGPRPYQAILWVLIVVVVLAMSGDQLTDSPQTRIIESVICYRHYEVADPSKILIGRDSIGPGAVGGVAELYCKENSVQSQLAMLRGYQQFLDGFPALLMAIPLGWAADTYGRKPFLLLGMLSFVLRSAWIQFVTWYWQAFDIRMIWWSTLHGLIAGSSPVVSGLYFVALSDVTPELERAAVFLRVSAFNLMAALCIPPLAAWLMEFSPWIPSIGGTLLTAIAALLYAFTPETLGYQDCSPSSPKSLSRTPPPESLPAPPDLANSGPISENFAGRIYTKEDEGPIAFLTRDWRVPALIVPFVAHTLLFTTGMLLLQYCSKRYLLTLSKATLLLTVMNAARVLLLLVLLPWISTLVMRVFHLSPQRKDLYLSRASQLLGSLGWIFIGLSPNIPTVAIGMVITSIGQGALLLVRSFITSLVPAHHIARVYSIISIVDTLGAMFGGALLAALFKRGVEMGGGWIGLPWLVLGLVSAACTALLFMVNLRPGEDETNNDRVEQDL